MIFVGDSSLGNSINAELFSEKSGKKAENYALTGSLGFKASYNMMKTVHDYNPNLKTVVIVQTIDMFTRGPAPDYKLPRKYFGIELDIFNTATFRLFTKAIKKHLSGKANPSAQIGYFFENEH